MELKQFIKLQECQGKIDSFNNTFLPICYILYIACRGELKFSMIQNYNLKKKIDSDAECNYSKQKVYSFTNVWDYCSSEPGGEKEDHSEA